MKRLNVSLTSIRKRCNSKTGISFEIGEKVKVCDGPFASFNGLIEEIDEENLDLKSQFLYLVEQLLWI